jgi:hypothetical protein
MTRALPAPKKGASPAIWIPLLITLSTFAYSERAHAENRCVETVKKALKSLTPSGIKTSKELTRIKRLIREQENTYLKLLDAQPIHALGSVSVEKAKEIRKILTDETDALLELQKRRHELEGGFQTIPMKSEYVGESLGVDEWAIQKRATGKLNPNPVDYFIGGNQRDAYRAHIDSKGLFTDHDENPLDGIYSFVMDQDGNVYLINTNEKMGLTLKHSSFLAGEPVAAVGELRIEQGRIVQVTGSSGHYKPDPSINEQFFEMLRRHGCDVSKIRHTHDERLER